MTKKKNVILGVTGSVAIYKACEIVRRLKEKGFLVTVVMTPEAESFIKPILFQSLSGNKVYCGLFDKPESWDIEHVSLAGSADIVVIAPATANNIGKIAAGICDDLLTCVVAATKAPVLICPAMNENMYMHKIVQNNIQALKQIGFKFVGPKKGKLACDKIGVGCLADTEIILTAIENIL
jgi:phosphopantothenoylcysteine decarboxylase/phosphopantothenate--cysteine ligase